MLRLTHVGLTGDDCCHTIDIGVSYQAQAFNFIRALDPYHVVTGASEITAQHFVSCHPF